MSCAHEHTNKVISRIYKQEDFFACCNDSLFTAWESMWICLPIVGNSQDRNSARFNVYPLKSIALICLAQEEQFPHTEVNLRRKLLLSICLSNPGILESLYPLAERDTGQLWFPLILLGILTSKYFSNLFIYFNFYGAWVCSHEWRWKWGSFDVLQAAKRLKTL